VKALLGVAVVAACLAVSGSAGAVGPWPGLAPSVAGADGLRYTAARNLAEGSTTVKAIRRGAVVASATLDGQWGIPAVTSTGVGGGLSHDGRRLILAEPTTPDHLRAQSRFLELATKDLSVVRTIVLRGEFGFDVLSPDARTLYLIQHTKSNDLVAYRVRAYDLRAHRLLPGTIVAKGESATMRGYPVTRATSTAGTWVYTLYTRNGNADAPFVHALNAARRYAVCIDLPQATGNIWLARLGLSADGRHLTVRVDGATLARIDTRSFKVS
jgi:hypothetical protein